MKPWKPTIKNVLLVTVLTLGVTAMAHDLGTHIADKKETPRAKTIEVIPDAASDVRADLIYKARPLPTASSMTVSDQAEATEPTEQTEPETPATTEGRALYDIPLPADLQLFVIELCAERHIDHRIVFAIMAKESNFVPDALGDNGNSHGLMQIQPRWHQGLMTRLGCHDLLDPKQNVTVGVELLSVLFEKYGTWGETLTVYNAGDGGAWNNYFSKGVFASDYALSVLSMAENMN